MKKMLRWYNIYTACILVFWYLQFSESTYNFPKNCTETEIKYQSVQTPVVVYSTYKTCKWKWLGWGCRYLKRSRKEIRTMTIAVNNTVNVCCKGFIDSDNDTCVNGCPIGFYGPECRSNCTCPVNAYEYCEKMSGNCTCFAGKMGEKCQQDCQEGRFGIGCTNECLCKNNSTCNPVNGTCSCTNPGHIGEHCDQACSEGSYGLNCNKQCNCLDTQTCDHITGECYCRPGRTGVNCTEYCTNFTYGNNCSRLCTCVQNNTAICNSADGTCDCNPGWEGTNCQSVCTDGHYGKNCNTSCNCSEHEICEPVSGICLSSGFCNADGTENCEERTVSNCSSSIRVNACKAVNLTTVNQIRQFMSTICNCKDTDTFCVPQNNSCLCQNGYIGEQCEKEIDDCKDDNIHCGTGYNLAEKQSSSNSAIIGGSVVGILIVFVVGAIIAFLLVKRKRKSRNNDQKQTTGGGKTSMFSNAAYETEPFEREGKIISNGNEEYDYARSSKNILSKGPLETDDGSNYVETANYNQINFSPSSRQEPTSTALYSHLADNVQSTVDDGYVYDVTSHGRSAFGNENDNRYGVTRNIKATADDTYDETRTNQRSNNDDEYNY